jgi:hypothetical protein
VSHLANRVVPADSDISTVEDMFDELVRRGGNPVREVAAALRAIGYVQAVPERMGDNPREVYLGWADPARDYTRGKFTLSLDSRTVWFRQQDDQRGIQGNARRICNRELCGDSYIRVRRRHARYGSRPPSETLAAGFDLFTLNGYRSAGNRIGP